MNSSGHSPVSQSAANPQRKGKSPRKNGSRPRNATAKVSRAPSPVTLARTKTLLLAALRVWELKHRITVD